MIAGTADYIIPDENAPSAGDGSIANAVAVLAALEDQVGCYRQLAKLAIRQHELVRLEMTEDLLSLLAERQVVLARIGELEETAKVARRSWPAFAPTLSAEERALAQRLMNETRALLAEITSGDERDALVIQQRRHHIGGEIKATVAARSVNRTYAASAYGRQRASSLDARS